MWRMASPTSRITSLFLGLFLTGALLSAEENAENKRLLDAAADTAAEQAGKSLMDSELGAIKNIAIYRLDGDEDGYITTALTTSFIKTGKGKLEVMAREELDKLMQEHRKVLKSSDLFVEENRKELGKLLNVDAIIFGEVREATVEGKKATVRLILRLGEVESGRMPWADTPIGVEDQTPPPPWR